MIETIFLEVSVCRDEIALAVLRVFEQTLVGRHHRLSGPVDIDLARYTNARLVSRHHALLVPNANGWAVRDLESRNGVFHRKDTALRPVRVWAEEQVFDGSSIWFGPVRCDLRFVRA
jgi:pSer/pThr/pTyr-binding forkhead associated (FHA) protein